VRLPQKSKSRLLAQAVDANLDFIHGRLPAPLRPARRRFRALRSWAGRAALPVMMFVAVSLGGSLPSPAAGGWPSADAPHDLDAAAFETAPALEPSAVAPRFSHAVLGLGVRRVVIDAGHGGDDPGATGINGLTEKAVTLDLAQRLRSLVVKRGFEAVMTRDTDTTMSLEARAAIANAQRGDVFVSIHLNSFEEEETRGIETYYVGPNGTPELDALAARENQHAGYSLADLRTLLERVFADAKRDESHRLARAVQDALVRSARKTDPGITNRGVKTASFVVLAAAEMPSILAEVSFLSNTADASRLHTTEYRQQIAEALASGVTSFAWKRATASKGQKVHED
jgi:N-acetylmuramoyl-L-alanine amidase